MINDKKLLTHNDDGNRYDDEDDENSYDHETYKINCGSEIKRAAKITTFNKEYKKQQEKQKTFFRSSTKKE